MFPSYSGGNLSMLLLKPDAMRSDSIRSDFDRLAHELALKIIDRCVVTLSGDDVLDVWPRFACDKFPISRELNTLYMTSGECEGILVSGPSAASKAVSIRNRIRRTHRAAPFANFIHAPTDPIELASNVTKFFSTDRVPGEFIRHADDSEPVGVWGRFAKQDKEEAIAAARQVWIAVNRGGWDSIWSEPVIGQWILCLKRGALQSIDFGISALRELISEWPAHAVISTYLEAEHRGEVSLLSGTSSEIRTLCWRATDLGILTRVEDPARNSARNLAGSPRLALRDAT